MTGFGKELLEGLEEFRDALKANDGTIPPEFTCRRVVLNLAPEPFPPDRVKETRRLLSASQAIFAQFLGVSTSCLQSWEQGIQEPPGMACRFMYEILTDPEYWQKRLLDSMQEANSNHTEEVTA